MHLHFTQVSFYYILHRASKSFEGEQLYSSKKHISSSDRRFTFLSQIFASQDGVILVATVTSQAEHAPRGWQLGQTVLR